MNRDGVVHALAALIGSDEPGSPAEKLARTVVALVERREPAEAALLARDIEPITNRYRRVETYCVDLQSRTEDGRGVVVAINLQQGNPIALCVTCSPPTPAVYIAEGVSGKLWCECAKHGPSENLYEQRIKRTLIGAWQEGMRQRREGSSL